MDEPFHHIGGLALEVDSSNEQKQQQSQQQQQQQERNQQQRKAGGARAAAAHEAPVPLPSMSMGACSLLDSYICFYHRIESSSHWHQSETFSLCIK